MQAGTKANICPYTDIFAVDPGSDTLGIAILRWHYLTDQVEVIHTVCLSAAKAIDKNSFMAINRGLRFARIRWLSISMLDYLREYAPHVYIAESPFMGRMATAFEALVETRVALTGALEEYDPYMPYNQIDPRSTKSLMGCVDTSKEAMRDAVIGREELIWATPQTKYLLTEHEYDAIGVGCWLIEQYRAGR